jgi:hypothetical protein
MAVMSAFIEWHLGHVVRLIRGRGSGSIPKTMDGNAEVRLSRIAHRIALLDLAQEWKLRKIGAGSQAARQARTSRAPSARECLSTVRQRPEYGEAIEQEIGDAIRSVLQRYAREP